MNRQNRKTVDKIEIVGPYNILHVRELVETVENDKVVDSNFHRYTVFCTNYTQYDQTVQLVASTMHDNDTVVAFRRSNQVAGG